MGKDRVYFATLGSRVYALRPDGAVEWTWDYVQQQLGWDGDRWSDAAWRQHLGRRVSPREQFLCSRDIARDLELWKVRSPLSSPLAAVPYDRFTRFSDWGNTNSSDQQIRPPFRLNGIRRYEGTAKHFSSFGGGRTYTHTAEGQVFAVEQETGRLLWGCASGMAATARQPAPMPCSALVHGPCGAGERSFSAGSASGERSYGLLRAARRGGWLVSITSASRTRAICSGVTIK